MSVEEMPSDKELFQGAVSNEPEQIEQKVETPAAQDAPVDEGQQPRDENGRFATKAETPEQQTAQPAAEQQPKPSEQDAHVPSWRLREVREEAERRARDTEANLERERQARLQLEAQLRQLQQQAQPQTPLVDMLADPDKWQAQQRQQLQGMAQSVKFETSEMFARQIIGDQKVDEAYKWFETNMDPSLAARVNNSRHPWGEMVKAYEERKTLQEIGNDLGAYRNKLEEQLLNDPGFMQKVGERLRAQAGQPQPNGQRPANITQLPPSLRNLPSGSPNADLAEAGMSDAALFRYATR